MFKCANDGKKFVIPDWVILFGFGEGGGVVAYWVALAVRVALVEDSACGELGGVYF